MTLHEKESFEPSATKEFILDSNRENSIIALFPYIQRVHFYSRAHHFSCRGFSPFLKKLKMLSALMAPIKGQP